MMRGLIGKVFSKFTRKHDSQPSSEKTTDGESVQQPLSVADKKKAIENDFNGMARELAAVLQPESILTPPQSKVRPTRSRMTKVELKDYLAARGLHNVSMFSIVEQEKQKGVVTIKFSDKRGTYIGRTWVKPNFSNPQATAAYTYTNKLFEIIINILVDVIDLNEATKPGEGLIITFDEL